MHVAVLTLELWIPGAESLKDKRSVVKSLLDRMAGRWNVSCAQLDTEDVWTRATLGVAVISNSQVVAQRVLHQVRDFVESEPRCDVTACSIENL